MTSPIYKIPLTPFPKQITNECISDERCELKGSMPICCFKCDRLEQCKEEEIQTCEDDICPCFKFEDEIKGRCNQWTKQ